MKNAGSTKKTTDWGVWEAKDEMLLWRIQRQNLYMTYVQCEIVLLYPETGIRMKSTGPQGGGSRARLELQTTAGLTLVEWTRCDRKTEQRLSDGCTNLERVGVARHTELKSKM